MPSQIPIFELPPVAVPQGPRFEALPENTFPAQSLLAWISLAQENLVPYIEATAIASIPLDGLLRFDEPENPLAREALGLLDQANQMLDAGSMLRWDCCVGFEVKAQMAQGTKPGLDDCKLYPGEMRTFDLLYDYPADTIAIVHRPWVVARQEAGFPVEFRVFVIDGNVAGVANYYLQRALATTAQNEQWANQCAAHANTLIASIRTNNCLPWMSGVHATDFDQSKIQCTLDFLVDEQGQVLLLEGGPGFGFGAHPCAFWDAHTGQVDPIFGIKLGVGEASLPLSCTG